MPIAEYAFGTLTVTVGTEHFPVTPDPSPDDGMYQFVVDIGALTYGDELEIRIYEAALSTDTTSSVVEVFRFAGPQSTQLWVSPGFLLLHRWRFSIKQTAGTARTFKWSIRRIT